MAAVNRQDIQAALAAVDGGQDFSTVIDELGLVDPGRSAEELRRHAAVVLLQHPDAVFYLAADYAHRLADSVTAAADDILQAVAAVNGLIAVYRPPDPVLLDRASSALDRAISAGRQGLASPYSVAAAAESMRAYADDVDIQFITSATPPSVLAASRIQTLISTLSDQVDDIVNRLSWLSSMSSVQDLLVRVVTHTGLPRIQTGLDDRRQQLTTLSTLDLQTELQALYLFLRAGELMLTGATVYPDPFADRHACTCLPSNSPTSPAERVVCASITGSASFPFAIATPLFTVEFNGVSEAMPLPQSPPAEVVNGVDEPYTFWAAVQASVVGNAVAPFNLLVNYPWVVYVDGIPFAGTLLAGVYPTVAAIWAHMDVVLVNADAGPLSDWVVVVDDGGAIRMEYDHLGDTVGDHRLITAGEIWHMGVNNILGFGPDGVDSDDLVDPRCVQGLGQNNTLTLTVDAVAAQTVVFTSTVHTAVQLAAAINASTTDLLASAVGPRVGVASSTVGDGARLVIDGGTAVDTAGFYAGQHGYSRHITAVEVLSRLTAYFADGLVQAAADSQSTTLSEGVCTTVLGVGDDDKLDLPAGEGAAVAVGQKLVVRAGVDAGAYEIMAVVGDRVTLDRRLWEAGAVLAFRYLVVFAPLTLSSTKADGLDSSVDSLGAPSLFGLPLAGVVGQVSAVVGDTKFVHTRAGDWLTMAGDWRIDQVDGKVAELADDVNMDMAATPAVVVSADYRSWSAMSAATIDWTADFGRDWPNFRALRGLANRALSGPSAANRAALVDALTDLAGAFAGPGSAGELLADFVVRPLPVVDRLLATTIERGGDRGAELLKSLDFQTFFAVGAGLSDEEHLFGQLAGLLADAHPAESVGVDVDDQLVGAEQVVGIDLDDSEHPFVDVEDEFLDEQ